MIANLFNNLFGRDQIEKVDGTKVTEINKDRLTKFYKNSNVEKVQRNFVIVDRSEDILKSLGKHPVSLKISCINERLEATINAKTISPNALMTYIAFYFDEYDADNNVVFTNSNSNIINFISRGLNKMKKIGFKFVIDNRKSDYSHVIRTILNYDDLDDKFVTKLSNNFKKLEMMNWNTFHKAMEDEFTIDVENERIEEITSMELPEDWLNVFTNSEVTKGIHVDTAADGLILSLNNLGRVDIEYISEITGLSCKEVILDLKGAIFQNPSKWEECFYKGWETADEYLSGRIVEKFIIAKEANDKYQGYFNQNVIALEQVMPKGVTEDEVYITLGSPWIPTDIIDDFIAHLFGRQFMTYKTASRGIERTKYDADSGIWEIPASWKNSYLFSNTVTFGTKRYKGMHLLEKALNSEIPTSYDSVKVGDKTKSVFNKEETILAREKQNEIIEEFRKWVWNDPVRKQYLLDLYNDKYCSVVTRKYDGSFLQFPGLNPDIELFDYQKNAVARILFSPNTLLAHDVGAGKTFIMIASGMEKRRMGLSKKNLYVVPNSLVGQWNEIFKTLYPGSNVLAIDPKSFTPDKRNDVLKKIRDEDYDGIIMAYSSYSLVPLSKKFYVEKTQKEIERIQNRINTITKGKKDNKKKLAKLEETKNKLLNRLKLKDENVYFDDLGITGLYVDEAHNYKNLLLESQTYGNGLSLVGSKKCTDMLDKVHYIQSINNGGGVVFATGTPITNSLTDIFAMQKYLQDGELSLLNLQSLDSWIGMFAERKAEFEIDVDANNYKMRTRYSKFHNIPELSLILSSITDFYQIDKETELPELESYSDVLIPKSPLFKIFLDQICQRVENIRQRNIFRKDDNLLKITTDGRKAALDMRLINPALPFSYDSKVYFCAENVYNIYRSHEDKKSTQIVFCDSSTPKEGFNVYDSLKDVLVKFGIPAEEIAYIHDAVNDKQRNQLFKKVQKGQIRILIGSTPKLGLGVNVQDKLVALHHLDIPWRPADMIQREGRILRKGNENEKVHIFRYITDGSFDAYSYQLLESKQRMIRDILSGTMPKRMCDELDDVVLNYAEIKAIAVGYPLLKERVEVFNSLSRYRTLQKRHIEKKHNLEYDLLALPRRIELQKERIENCILDCEYYENNKRKYSTEERNEIRKKIYDALYASVDYINPEKVCEYQGFDVIVPNNLLNSKNIIYIEKHGRYTIESGDSEVGVLIRVDNFLEGFEETLKKEKDILTKLEERKVDIEQELAKETGYIDEIAELQLKLEELDEKLGVNKDAK